MNLKSNLKLYLDNSFEDYLILHYGHNWKAVLSFEAREALRAMYDEIHYIINKDTEDERQSC